MSRNKSEEVLERSERLTNYFEARKARATARLQRLSVSGRWLCLAIVGLETAEQEFAFLPTAILRVVEEPPGEVELACALKDPGLMSVVGRYSSGFRHELAICTRDAEHDQGTMNLAWWLISALRMRCLPDIIVPVVADHSWSTIAALPANSCSVQVLEDAPRARKFGAPRIVQRADVEWVSDHIEALADLLEDQRFRLAVDALTTHHHHENVRMMVAMLWSGIEGLMALDPGELAFKLGAYIAVLLEPGGPSRAKLFSEVKGLYGTRSKAVHGANLEVKRVEEHVVKVRELLARLLCACTEHGRIPNRAELEDHLFHGTALVPTS